MTDLRPLLGFLVFALVFAGGLTCLVHLARLRVRAEMPYAKALGLTALFVGVVLLGWWFVTRGSSNDAETPAITAEGAPAAPRATPEHHRRLIPALILPSPMEVLRAFRPLHFEQGLVRSALTSWARVTVGFLLAAIVAVPLGVYMATFPSIAAFFRPLALTGAYVPIIVFIPLSISWFGIGEPQKIGFLFIGCFVALLPLVIKDIADVPSAFLDVAVTKGASQWQLVRHVLFPVAQANIWDHLRGVYGVGWGWIIMAEVVVQPPYGLGRLIEVSNRRSHTDAIFAIIIVIVLIAVACDQLWRRGGDWLFPYRRTDD
jgi:NitT/TauT family transport system permease protein